MSASSAFHGTFVHGVTNHQRRAGHNGTGHNGTGHNSPADRGLGQGGSRHGNVYPISTGRRTSPAAPGAQGRPAAASPSRKQPPLRRTRRGRFVFFGVPLILLAALILSFSGFLNAPAKAADSADQLSLTPTVSVTVQPGESLWAIAGSVAPERDPRDVVADIVQLNNLDAARVMPGQQLFVPSK